MEENKAVFDVSKELTKIMVEGNYFERIKQAEEKGDLYLMNKLVEETIDKSIEFFNELYLDTPEAQEAKKFMIEAFIKYQREYFGLHEG